MTVKAAHVRLCHSRMLFVRAYPRETQEMVFDAHDRAFALFKGPARAARRRSLRRVAENAQRIALISAVGRDPQSPVIEMRDFDIGHALARWSATTMIHNIASHIADNQTERDVNDVERFIQESGERGRTWNDVQRKFRRVKARDLKEIYESLEREGSIRVETTPIGSGGWPVKTAFRI